MPTCDYCGDAVTGEEAFTLALEWPAEQPEAFDDPAEFDDPGAGVLALCADCADAVATDILVDRAVHRGLDDVYADLEGDLPADLTARVAGVETEVSSSD